MKTNSYRYAALSEDSYNSLAAFASTIPAQVTLFPALHIIVVANDGVVEIGKFIDDNALDFQIGPIEIDADNLMATVECEATDPYTLREIISYMKSERASMKQAHEAVEADFKRQRDMAKSRCDRYSRWFNEASARNDRVKAQVEAIAALISSIYPKE
jgi:hypothetical protein